MLNLTFTASTKVVIGDRVIIHPNAVIGADGFGFASGKKGITKIPQVGTLHRKNGYRGLAYTV